MLSRPFWKANTMTFSSVGSIMLCVMPTQVGIQSQLKRTRLPGFLLPQERHEEETGMTYRVIHGLWLYRVNRGNGEGGIRTHGHFRDTRSPGAPDRPLQHLSTERVGFEPTLQIIGDRFSRAAPSTTRSPLQSSDCTSMASERAIRQAWGAGAITFYASHVTFNRTGNVGEVKRD
jgi:hypothetical protein